MTSTLGGFSRHQRQRNEGQSQMNEKGDNFCRSFYYYVDEGFSMFFKSNYHKARSFEVVLL